MTETRCFHCKLDVAPADEDGCCNNCGADLGCTCATEADTGNHTDDCAISVREDRDRLRKALRRCVKWIGRDSLDDEDANRAYEAGKRALREGE